MMGTEAADKPESQAGLAAPLWAGTGALEGAATHQEAPCSPWAPSDLSRPL